MSVLAISGSAGKATTPAPLYEGDFVVEGDFQLDCGRVLRNAVLRYAVYGRLDAGRENAVLVCHALSGSALAGEWWPGLFGSGEPATGKAAKPAKDGGSPPIAGIVDLERDCAICVNLLGSCYGSTGPGSVDPESGRVYGADFPLVSIRDNVRAQARLLDSLGIARLRLSIGGSIGGMQALEWSILYPERVERAVIIAVAPLSAMGLALNHLQRKAIQDDPDWLDGLYQPGKQPRSGLALARQIGMLSYKSAELFTERFGRSPNRNGEDPWALSDHGGGLAGGRFDVAGFLDYQGERFVERFDANAYLAILRTMDTWEPGRGFSSPREAYRGIQAELVLIGIGSDWLFPAADVRKLAEDLRVAGVRAEYREMASEHGHDAFLAEQAALIRLLHPRV